MADLRGFDSSPSSIRASPGCSIWLWRLAQNLPGMRKHREPELSVFFWSVRSAHGCAFRTMLRPLSLIRALCAGAIRPYVPESTFRLSPLLASLALVLGCG